MKKRLKSFLKIYEHINKKFCNDKLKISKIVFFKRCKDKPCKAVIVGYYKKYNKVIGIKLDKPLISQIDTLCHELSHAYQHQILGHSARHDKKGGKIYHDFLKETDKILKVDFKKI